MSHFKSAIALFVGMAILTVISLICCGTALSRNFAYEADIRNNERRLNDLRQAVEQTRTQTAAQSQRYLDEQKRFQTHLADMTSQLQEQTHLRETLDQELPPLAGKVDALKEEVATLEQRKNDLDTTLQQAEAAKRELSELSLKITTAKNVEKSLEQSIAALNARLAEASAKQKEANLARDTAEQEQKKISDSLNAVRKEWDDLLKKRDGLLEEIANLKKDAATLKAELASRDALTDEIKKLVAEIAKLQGEKKQYDTISAKLAAAMEDQAQLNKARQELDNLKGQRAVVEGQRAAEQAKLESVRRDIDQQENLKKQVEQLKAELAAEQGKVDRLRQDYHALNAQIGTMKGERDALENQRAAAKDAKARAEKQADEARAQLVDLNRKVEAAKEELRKIQTPATPQGEAQSGQQQ